MTISTGIRRRSDGVLCAVLLSSLLWTLSGCSLLESLNPHPFEGRIYIPSEKRFIPESELLERMKRAGVVYLGEKHDNPEHHRLQARVLRALIGMGRKPAVVFEMFSRDVNPSLAAHLENPNADLKQVPKIVRWSKSGWPDWAMYAPLVEVAHNQRIPVLGADLNSAISRKVGRGGLRALPPELARELALGSPDAKHRSILLGELYESHCRVMPKEKLSSLYDAWRARNRFMALTIVKAVKEPGAAVDGAVMITGGGHADREKGIPPHISKLAPDLTQFSLGFIESKNIRNGLSELSDYQRDFDALWITSSTKREDPCVEFRESLERMRSRK